MDSNISKEILSDESLSHNNIHFLKVWNTGSGDTISFENIVIQSKLYMTGAELELNIILAHGILHLLGYDHYDDNSKREMDNLTTKSYFKKN